MLAASITAASGGIEELKALNQRLLGQGFEVEDLVDRGITKSLHLRDPDGNRLELFCEVMEPEAAKAYIRGNRAGSKPLTLEETAAR